MPSLAPDTGSLIMQRVEELALISESSNGLTRRFATPEHRQANQLASLWMERAGMQVHEDAIGNVIGRYEGVDERVLEHHVDEEWSIGDFVLSGGELPTMVMIDAVARLLPDSLGNSESAAQDSFAHGMLDCPHYARPEVYAGEKVPEVLLSGNHKAIERWREQQALGRTWERRPELLEKIELTDHQQGLLDEYKKLKVN